MALTYEYRRDGWPLCPQCGEDELASTHGLTNARNKRGDVIGHLVRPPKPTDPMKCYSCHWVGVVPPRPPPGFLPSAQT